MICSYDQGEVHSGLFICPRRNETFFLLPRETGLECEKRVQNAWGEEVGHFYSMAFGHCWRPTAFIVGLRPPLTVCGCSSDESWRKLRPAFTFPTLGFSEPREKKSRGINYSLQISETENRKYWFQEQIRINCFSASHAR